ncbi:M14 family metallopeptidase [Chitinophagaceae bacterium LWZ2-11]
MRKLTVILAIMAFCYSSFAQTLQSPEQFLGYKPGTRFTRHYKIVDYFKAVAQAKPDLVKVEKYGETSEGRELMLAYIATPENLQKIEEIRKNNLRISGVLKDNVAAQTNAPAVVWLSYNVHGNEPSSSEAAMMTLYALVDPNNTQTKEWLKNTIVIIDPCINPDGRDRYVNWYNSVVGKNYNADPQSREHSEPWPGGRSNHYNFDMNRDWAWQTQTESQQRMKKYNEWLPQIHVDFHEQGYDEPYYFAPAAEPYHEVITQWQRDFQVIIGKNNAKYFDSNGWLYFTKERFDLFYPSYGDTYPLYNGAIGMTFEQGGHSRGGLAVVKSDGDTLTLVDRAMHHYTTGLSTIEATSKNAQKVMDEYKKFFDESSSGKKFVYKTYILTSDNKDKLAGIQKLLQQNGIQYGTIGNQTFKGLNYITLKEEAGSLKKYNLTVSLLQPKATLASVLLEPKSNLSDSNTYDITAWSLPYAYGVDAYAVKEVLNVTPASPDGVTPRMVPVSNYGYLIKYNSMAGAKALANLLKAGVKVRYATKPFTYNKELYDRGTLIVLSKGNPADLNVKISSSIRNSNVEVASVESGFMDKGADFGSPDIRFIEAPKVALLTGEQVSSTDAGEVWNLFDQTLDYPISLFNANDLQRINLKNYNVLILPDGYYRSLNDKTIADKLKEFVRGGGKLVALQGAVQQMAAGDWGLKLKEDKQDDTSKKDDYAALKKYEDRNNDYLKGAIPGAIYKVDLDNTHPLAFGYPAYYYTLKQDANLYEFLKDGWNVGVLKKDSYVAGFTGSKLKPKMKDGLLFGVDEMGAGSVVYLSDNPLFRLFWENGKLLFCNAVFLVGQ